MNITHASPPSVLRSASSVLGLIIFGALTSVTTPAARAANDTWQGAAGTQDWNNSSNWIGGNIPGSTSVTTTLDDALFNGTTGGASTVTIDSNRNIRRLTFTSTTLSYVIGSAGANGGNTLLISNSGIVGINTNVSGAVAQTINAPLTFQGTTGEIWSDSSTSTATMTFNGNISYAGNSSMTLGLRGRNTGANTVNGVISNGSSGGTLSVNKAGQNTSLWVLSGTNTYTGSTVVTGGILRAGSAQAYGINSAVVLGTTTAGATAALDLNGNNNTVGSLATTSSALSNGTVTLGSATLTISGANETAVDFAGVISGSGGSLLKNGAGIQILSAANTYTGGTNISAGTLLVNNTTGSGTGTGAVTVDNGATFGGSGIVSGDTTVASGSFLSAGAAAGSAGTLTFTAALDISGLASGSGGLLFDLGATTSSDKIVLSSGALTLGSGLLNFSDFSFTTLDGFGAGIYTLIDTSTSIIGTLGSSLTGTIDGFTGTLFLSGNDLILTVAVIPEPSTYAALLGALALAGTALRRRTRLA